MALALAEQFGRFVDELPADWTDLQVDLRVDQEERYVEAAVILSQANPQPYSRAGWHWRVLVAHSFGHATFWGTLRGVLRQLDASGFTGELVVHDVRQGRVEFVPTWGRPLSVREEFARRRAQ
jgi:hypothetical protein